MLTERGLWAIRKKVVEMCRSFGVEVGCVRQRLSFGDPTRSVVSKVQQLPAYYSVDYKFLGP